ncbi:MAG: CotH kinase family protein [Clostridia bacterium]|nr:CotH kinase family protein [Clostridia bacterium]
MAAAAVGLIGQASGTGYEARLFDQGYVHTIDIVMNDWDAFLETCRSEEYAECTLVIDGESYKNIAIRGKGNTSLSSVSSYGNDRYSFKIEFDHYQTGKTYYGLDKLSLNNLIYDNTYMKDYFAYTLMNKMGVASPLCSFAEIRVNGEVWGTYLVVEGVEDAFLKRNYGVDHGELYKPDTMNFGGGRGNGRDFDMANFMEESDAEKNGTESRTQAFGGFDPSQMFGGGNFDFSRMPGGDFDPSQIMGGNFDFSRMMPDMGGMQMPSGGDSQSDSGRQFNFGMGGGETKLIYSDDDPDSYSSIFSSAKTDITEDDQTRLIAALKKLSQGDTAAVDTDAMMRYLAVHDFLQNGDSYTGSMVHNYYLYEENGVLSMIPWDYNLAYGTFMGGRGSNAINAPIDSPVSNGTGSDRPMVDWIFNSEETTHAYHRIYQQFMDECFANGWFEQEVDRLKTMLTPYVQRDATAFCTFEEFEKGVETLKAYGEKRSQSVMGQLKGEIPSTSAGQRNANNLIDTEGLDLSLMGSMGGGKDRQGNQESRRNAGKMPVGGMQGGFMPSFGGEIPAGNGQMPPAPQENAEGKMPSLSKGAGGFMPFPDENTPAEPENTQSEQANRQSMKQRNPAVPSNAQAAGTQENTVMLLLCAAVLLSAVIAARCFRRRE